MFDNDDVFAMQLFNQSVAAVFFYACMYWLCTITYYFHASSTYRYTTIVHIPTTTAIIIILVLPIGKTFFASSNNGDKAV